MYHILYYQLAGKRKKMIEKLSAVHDLENLEK